MQNAAKRNVWQMGCTDADVTGRCQQGARMHGAAQMFAWQVRTDQLIRTVIYMQRLRLLLVQRVLNSKPAASLCRTLF